MKGLFNDFKIVLYWQAYYFCFYVKKFNKIFFDK